MKNRVYLSKIPEIYYIDNFVKDKEIDYIINESKAKLTKANVSHPRIMQMLQSGIVINITLILAGH